MDKNEWAKVGEDIRNQVQQAIDSNDFSKLGKTIGDTVNLAMDGMATGINTAVNSVNQAVNSSFGGAGQSGQGGIGGQPGQSGQNGGMKPAQPDVKTYRSTAVVRTPNKRLDTQLFYRTPKGKTSGGFCVAAGFGTMGIAGLSLVGNLGSLLFAGGALAPVLVTMGLTAAGIGVGTYGLELRGRANRYTKYVNMVKDKLYCSIQDMALGTGRSEKFIRRDLKKMMQLGMFKQGHMDQKETYLIASDEMYEQYKLTMNNYEVATQTTNDAVAERTDLPESVRTVIEEGQNYVRMIRKCNDEIPGEEMTGKLDRLEFLVTRIFAQVEKEPDQAPELRKLLNYYLPTTQKLLEAYRDLDKQEVQVSNIAQTKKDIEQTVDTINQAFERFLDEMFRDTAWDIQSDISVLNTMLKQDGYLEKDFHKN